MKVVLLTITIMYNGNVKVDTDVLDNMMGCLTVAANVVHMLNRSPAVVAEITCEVMDGS